MPRTHGALVLVLLVLLLAPIASADPSIALLSVPSPGSTQDWVAGVVEGAVPADWCVVLYIQVDGLWWGPKPTWAEPLTPIRSDGFWNATFATGGNDLAATRFTAYLVPLNAVEESVPPALAGAPSLPAALDAFPCDERARATPVYRAAPSFARNGTDLVGLCVGPYLDGERPGVTILSTATLHDRLAVVAPRATWLRSYGVDGGLERFGSIVHALGRKAAVGAWLTTDPTANRRALLALVECGRAGDADLLIVGSECLIRGDLSERDLAACLEWVRREVPGVPVATADGYAELLAHPAVVEASDILVVHVYPFWEGVDVAAAPARTVTAWESVTALAGGRTVVIGELGWPDAGGPRDQAVPSAENAKRYLHETMALLEARGVPYFYFAAFDEAWKTAEPGGVGPHWGLWTGDLVLKPGRLPPPSSLLQLPGGMDRPNDLDGDGLVEDVNGNQRTDFADVVLFFNQMDWITGNEPVGAFDWNGNGRIDFADIVRLFVVL
ncbi:Glycosyl hydrolases family 17 [anaerobic digester metagenome]